jgi:dienelactone hydrolase
MMIWSLICFLVLTVTASAGQKSWPPQVSRVEIPCDDGSRQPAMWFAPAHDEPVPLLVGLHTWSSHYDTAGSDAVYADWCVAQAWAFIHPHFRGPNRTAQAMGSDRAVRDIVEAVAWAKQRTSVDGARIYLVGVSGGGHMALLMAGRHPEIWAGVSSWCGISDIAAWHGEHLKDGLPDEYARDIESALGRAPLPKDAEAWKRSPLSCLAAAAGVPLDINHGIHDGRKGSVRFTHSLHAWNAVVPREMQLEPDSVRKFYETRQLPPGWPSAPADPSYGKCRPLFRVTHANTRVTLFEGGHEMVHAAALNWLARQRRGQPAVWTLGELIPIGGGDSGTGR